MHCNSALKTRGRQQDGGSSAQAPKGRQDWVVKKTIHRHTGSQASEPRELTIQWIDCEVQSHL